MMTVRNRFSALRLTPAVTAAFAVLLSVAVVELSADDPYGGGGSSSLSVAASGNNYPPICIIQGSVSGGSGGETVELTGAVNVTLTAASDGQFYYEHQQELTGTVQIIASDGNGNYSDPIFVTIF